MNRGIKRFFIICAAVTCLGIVAATASYFTGGIPGLGKMSERYSWIRAGVPEMTGLDLAEASGSENVSFDSVNIRGDMDVLIARGSYADTRLIYDEGETAPTFEAKDGVLTVDADKVDSGVLINLGSGDSTPQLMKNSLGHAAYVLEGIRHLPINTSIHARVITDSETVEGDFIYGSLSNSTSIGGFPSPIGDQVVLDDGLFEMLLISAPKNLADLNGLVASLAQHDFSNPYIRLVRTTRAQLEFEEAVSFTLDGEFGGAVRTAQLEVLPRAIQMRLPAQAPLSGPQTPALPAETK